MERRKRKRQLIRGDSLVRGDGKQPGEQVLTYRTEKAKL